MNLRLLFIAACIVTGLHGAQSSTKKLNTSENASELQKQFSKARIGGVVAVFCDRGKQLTLSECKNMVQEFRKGVNGFPVIDYVVLGQKMHEGANGGEWVQNSTNIEAICKQSFYRTNNIRGRVLYATTSDDKKTVGVYISEIKSLKDAGWDVFVNAHDEKIAREINAKCFVGTTLVIVESDSSFRFRQLLFFGAMIGLVALICTNFDFLKSKLA